MSIEYLRMFLCCLKVAIVHMAVFKVGSWVQSGLHPPHLIAIVCSALMHLMVLSFPCTLMSSSYRKVFPVSREPLRWETISWDGNNLLSIHTEYECMCDCRFERTVWMEDCLRDIVALPCPVLSSLQPADCGCSTLLKGRRVGVLISRTRPRLMVRPFSIFQCYVLYVKWVSSANGHWNFQVWVVVGIFSILVAGEMLAVWWRD